jgi:hypothetical protein
MKPADDRGPLAALLRDGLLLESDPVLPSVAGLTAGAPIRGSWWGHPAGGAIYSVVNQLADRPDVFLARLVSGKVTLVHSRLWPHLLAIGCAGEGWQMDGLSQPARRLLRLVEQRAEVRSDDPAVIRAAAPVRASAAVLELERRLLILTRQVHTEQGKHTKWLESWSHWARAAGVSRGIEAPAARAELDAQLRS